MGGWTGHNLGVGRRLLLTRILLIGPYHRVVLNYGTLLHLHIIDATAYHHRKPTLFTIPHKIRLILGPEVLHVLFEPDSLFLQGRIGRLELELGIGYPLCPLHHTFLGQPEETHHDGLELLQISRLSEGTASILGDRGLIRRLHHHINHHRQQDLLGLLNELFRTHLETILQELSI